MLKEGICQPSNSQWASPLHMVRKKSGEWRPCGDYCRLNSVTIPDRYPLPHIQDVAYQFHGCKFFSTLDLARAYYHIPLAQEDKQKTAVITPFGLFEFNVMPFGLCNAAQSFQRFMDTVLRGLDFCHCYIDDVIVASKTQEEHEKHLRTIFERLRKYGLTINIIKCVFAQQEVQYLGCQISQNGISPAAERVEAIQKHPKPKTISDLRRFLGIINFYRRFIPGAARIQIPLNKWLIGARKKDKRVINWTPESERAFQECKQLLAKQTLLSYPKNAAMALRTDASDVSVGAVLEQKAEENWKPLGFYSHRLDKTQSKYSTYDRELLAIYLSVKYLYIIIGQFSTKIIHIAGTDNTVADALSRIETIDMPVIVSTTELANTQTTDDELQEILKNGNRWNLHRIQVDDSDVYIYCEVTKDNLRPYVPVSLRRKIFTLTHGLSHPSDRTSRKLISRSFFWPGMNKNIAEWARTCLACQRSKVHRYTKNPPDKFETPKGRFEHVHMDIVGPLPICQNFRYCLTIIDRFSRWPEAIPLTEVTADIVATAFFTYWVSRFGASRSQQTRVASLSRSCSAH